MINMHATSLAGRTSYAASGSVDWTRFSPLLLLALLASALGAGLLYLLLTWGFYFIIIVPVIFGLGVAALMNLTVAKGHCRSRFVGGLAGLVCGVVLYLGYYYVGMLAMIGTENAARIDFLPEYISFRLNSDVSRDSHSPARDENQPAPRAGRFFLNVFAFGAEFIGIMVLTAGGGFRRARKPYCEGCKRWMERELTQFDPEKASVLIDAIKNGSAPSLAGLCAAPAFPSVPNTTLAVEFCPSVKEGGLRSCPVFASVKSITANAKGATLDAFESSQGKVLARAIQFNEDEVLALLPRFPIFESTSGMTAASALQQLRVPPPPAVTAPAMVASIMPVDPEHAGRVLTRKAKLMITAFSLLMLVMMFSGVGLMAWGGTTAFPDKKDGGEDVSPSRKILGFALLGVGGMLCMGGLGFLMFDASFLGNRYLKKLLKHELSSRPLPLVEPEDASALFVEIVPKANWGKLQLDNASDIGLLRVDAQRREILFEGDRERYRIPAAALISCNLEFFIEGEGTHGAMKIYYVVLRAHHSTVFWEAPIRERGNLGLFKTGRRKKRALELQSTIREIMAPTP